MPAVEIDDGFDRAWRRVGLALDRTGFTVEDRDRSKGLYFVRYVAPDPNRKEPSFLAKLFGSDEKNTSATKYQIQVAAAAKGSVVRLLDAQGRPAPADAARNILKIVADELK